MFKVCVIVLTVYIFNFFKRTLSDTIFVYRIVLSLQEIANVYPKFQQSLALFVWLSLYVEGTFFPLSSHPKEREPKFGALRHAGVEMSGLGNRCKFWGQKKKVFWGNQLQKHIHPKIVKENILHNPFYSPFTVHCIPILLEYILHQEQY